MHKKKQESKPTFASAYRNVKGFGSLDSKDQKKIKMSRFVKALSKDK